MRLIAAHDWDVLGAVRAGARAAYVARHSPLSEPGPDIIEPDLERVADAILGR